ncbi:hypothetical protein I552_6237 [Mycobacterium xenopi 3993]|nr:hypothetical protein I552_6237 [Mycobacterium xenopi 3993]
MENASKSLTTHVEYATCQQLSLTYSVEMQTQQNTLELAR